MRITIEDNGVGIKPENLNKLFMDFSKLDEHSAMNSKGTGLGLSICKKIIEKMTGKVEVSSKLGQGTKFFITLQMRCIDQNIDGCNSNLMTAPQKNTVLKEAGAFFCTDDFKS